MEVTQELLHELFEYKDGVLYWKVSRTPKIKIGDSAGTLYKTGYLYTWIKNKQYRNHRLIFLMHHGFLPKYIDHVDNNPLNNRIENLREATKSQNGYNQKLNKKNTSGIKGVCWCKTKKRWKVQIWVEGKNKHLGYYDSIEVAKQVVQEARLKYHGAYANHGKQNEKDCS